MNKTITKTSVYRYHPSDTFNNMRMRSTIKLMIHRLTFRCIVRAKAVDRKEIKLTIHINTL